MGAYVILFCDQPAEGGQCFTRVTFPVTDLEAARQAAAALGWTHDATRGDACRACSGSRPALRLEFPSR